MSKIFSGSRAILASGLSVDAYTVVIAINFR